MYIDQYGNPIEVERGAGPERILVFRREDDGQDWLEGVFDSTAAWLSALGPMTDKGQIVNL